jgi:hypothetical protein
MSNSSRMYKTMTPNEEYFFYNTSPAAYARLGAGIKNMQEVQARHAAVRGQYHLYPPRMVSVDPNQQLFVNCVDCGRAHCTDAWMPGVLSEPLYIPLYDRVRLEAVPDQNHPWQLRSLYHCTVELDTCAQKAILRKSG